MKKTRKDNRGGKREGAGRKPVALSVTQLKEMRESAAKKAKETGKSLFDICLEWVYDEDMKIDRRQAAWKMYCDKMLIAVSEGGEADIALGPQTYLPEQRPALEVVKDTEAA